jgi:hypothetical protein
MQRETRPYLPPVRWSSYMVFTVRIAPVAPTGWPRAMAPPLGLTLSVSIPRAAEQAAATEAKASFSSTTSI